MSATGNSEGQESSASAIVPTSGVNRSTVTKTNASETVKSTPGPRTPQGKERSKHNALKHGVFSKVVVLSDESKTDFEILLKGLVEHFQPEGALEEGLVDKLAALMWRQRRLLVAESAEIRKAREFLEWDKNRKQSIEAEERARKDAVESLFDLDAAYKEGLIWHIENQEIVDVCLELLEGLIEEVKSGGLNIKSHQETLQRLYGRQSQEHLNETLYRSYALWNAAAEVGEAERKEHGYASPEECKLFVIDAINVEIKRLKQFRQKSLEIQSKKLEIENLRQSVPDSPGLERLMRYETSLERQFDRTLTQLERIQRMRKGQNVPPPIKLDFTTS